MLTNVLTALRKAIVKRAAALRGQDGRGPTGGASRTSTQARRKFAQDRQTLDEENQAQVFCLKQEYEREVAYHKEAYCQARGHEVAAMDGQDFST